MALGQYEQDNNLSNGKEPIEWICVSKSGGRAILISKYCLDCQKYNDDYVAVTWQECSLNNWLNTTFYNNAFTDLQKQVILTDSNNCKVSILSDGDLSLCSNSTLCCYATEYSIANGNWVSRTEKNNGKCVYWLKNNNKSLLTNSVNVVGSVFRNRA